MLVNLLKGHIFLFVLFYSTMARCFPLFLFKRSVFGKSSNMIVSPRLLSTTPATPMPITVLSGFLGAGKTSFLNHILNNQEGLKFGLVVNDMATVNVDAKQIRQQNIGSSDGIDTMELQNGCVCCSIAEELIASVSKLISLSDVKGSKYDHIILECSGVAEPRKIRDLFQQAEAYDTQLLRKVRLDTMITVVDATVFFNLFGTEQLVSAHPDLAYNKDDLQMQANSQSGGEEGHRKVTELLLEQVECADIVLINKIDLLERESDVELVRRVITSINPNARILSCVKGGVPSPLSLPGSVGGTGAAEWGILDEHRNMVKAAEKSAQLEAEKEKERLLQESKKRSHDHSHSHKHSDSCSDTKCTDPSHHHDHSHKHSHEHKAECKVSACSDPTHNHSHGEHKHGVQKHDHKHSHTDVECAPTCTDPTHDHSHSDHSHHTHHHEESCADQTCTDPTHNHDHSHGHSHASATATTAETRFGITSFVYKRRTPFHPMRFSAFLNAMGKLSVSGIAEIQAVNKTASFLSEEVTTPLQLAQRSLLRSKGFVWMATSSAGAYFMSHAGQYLELMVLGRWWGDMPRADWPVGLEADILQDFDQAVEKGAGHADRRQELVFIGQFGGAGSSARIALEKALDDCLLTAVEMGEYETITGGGAQKEGPGSEAVDESLKKHFVRK